MSLFFEKRNAFLKECIMSLETCINLINEHSDDKENDFQTVKSITKDFCLVEEDFNNSPELLSSSTDNFEDSPETTQPTVEELEICKKHEIWKKIVENLINKVNDEENEKDEDLVTNNLDATLIFTTTFNIPSDPITKCPIKIPVVNTVCKHVYENETIQEYIKMKTKKKKKQIRCPYVGCVNDKLQASALELDEALRLKIADKLSTMETPKAKNLINISM